MDTINRAISPEQLALMRDIFAKEESVEHRAEALDRKLRAKADANAEDDDRNRHERRKAAALAKQRA